MQQTLQQLATSIRMAPHMGFVGDKTNPLDGWAVWWEYSDGEEGGQILFDEPAPGRFEVSDYDGAFDLPAHIKASLQTMGIDFE